MFGCDRFGEEVRGSVGVSRPIRGSIRPTKRDLDVFSQYQVGVDEARALAADLGVASSNLRLG